MHRREFLAAAAANGALLLAPATFASAVLEAQATRTTGGQIRLDWTTPNLPISIFVSTDPDAIPSYMRTLKTGVRRGSAELPLPISPRPYFLLSSLDGTQVRVAERLLPLQGGRNFRDLGGYRTDDGRQVRWGRIYRSGVMSELTAADMGYLSSLGIGVICDLRSKQERSSQPNPFVPTQAPLVVATDYDMLPLTALQDSTTSTEAISAVADAYVQFTQTLAPQYTDLFARLVRRETPLAFNCSAGKDRTGMGAALLLSVLGVPRQTVIADYTLTQVYAPPPSYLKTMAGAAGTPGVNPEQAKAMARMPHEVLMVIMGSDPAIMRQALDKIDQQYGGPIELAKSRLGLSDANVSYLRSVYLT
jgi:protein-tyrosine phosphatase